MIIKIRVLKGDSSKELYRNTVSVDDSIKFEFDKVFDVLTLLYPKSLVEFNCSKF